MAFLDLRAFMAGLARAGELVTVQAEVDWKLEVGAVIRRTCEQGARALHFRNIKGYDKTSLFGDPLGRGRTGIWSKLRVALGLDPETSYTELVETVIRRVKSPIRPLEVARAPHKENVLLGENVDLFRFPAPYLHEGDGGRYLGTWGLLIAQDPDSGAIHWDVQRQMIHSRSLLGGPLSKHGSVGRLFHQKYEPRRKPMPFAIALGTDPACMIVAQMPLASGVDPVSVAGGLRRQPVQLVKCETNELLVPTSSEIVLEGVIVPGEQREEGPFGEPFGYRTSPRAPQPVYRIQCVTYRNDPILPVVSIGCPIDAFDVVRCLVCDVELMQLFRQRGWPVRGCFTPPWLAGQYVAVTTKIPYIGFPSAVASVVRTSQSGKYVSYIQVCDDDIDPTDMIQLFHALVTKTHPKRDTQIIKEVPALAETPFLDPEERQFGRGSAIILDSTWPIDWDPTIATPPKASFTEIYPKAVQEKVLANWTTVYGFPREV